VRATQPCLIATTARNEPIETVVVDAAIAIDQETAGRT
jgi:hypothetical protein